MRAIEFLIEFKNNLKYCKTDDGKGTKLRQEMGQIWRRTLFQIEPLVGSQDILLFEGDSSQQRMGVFQSEPKLTNFVQKKSLLTFSRILLDGYISPSNL